MKTCVLAVGLALVAAAPPALALAQATISPAEAQAHAGQSVTVEGTVSEIHVSASGRATFVNLGGRFPNNAFSAVVFATDAGKFPNLSALDGKTIDVTGPVQLYKGRAEIVLTDAAQLKAK